VWLALPVRIAAALVLAVVVSLTAPAVPAGAAGPWAPIAPMPTPRWHAGAATGADGRVYVVGGFDPLFNPVATVFAYDPATNSWANVAPMPTARGLLAVAAGADGRVYAIGGRTAADRGSLAVVEAYTPATNSWARLAPLPAARSDLAAALGGDGRVYAIAGDPCSPVCFQNLPDEVDVHAYTPGTNQWQRVADLPTPRHGHAAATDRAGRVYAIGGYSSFEGYASAVERYDPATNAWTRLPRLPTARVELAAATGADGRIYAFGGTVCCDEHFSTTEVFDSSANRWEAGPPMTTPRVVLGGTADRGGRVYAIGGCAAPCSTNILSSAEALETRPGALTVDAGGPYAVAEGGFVVVSATGLHPTGRSMEYAWDLDGDGVFGTGGRSVQFSAAEIDGPTTRTIAVRATDRSGLSATATAVVTVGNVRPTATFAVSPAALGEGGTFTLAFTNATDPSVADRAAGFRYAVACGHGWSTPAPQPTQTCTAIEDRLDAVQGRVYDQDGAYTTYGQAVAVANLPPRVAVTSPAPGTAFPLGSLPQVSASFADPGVRDTHTCVVRWGDGRSQTGRVTEDRGAGVCFGFRTIENTYTAPGDYTITVIVRDDEGAEASATVAIKIAG
jgi:N-acetylneuraminic acid mutarotase